MRRMSMYTYTHNVTFVIPCVAQSKPINETRHPFFKWFVQENGNRLIKNKFEYISHLQLGFKGDDTKYHYKAIRIGKGIFLPYSKIFIPPVIIGLFSRAIHYYKMRLSKILNCALNALIFTRMSGILYNALSMV